MNPFGLPEHQLVTFARPLLEYLPAGYHAQDAAQSEIDDVGSLAALASPDVVAARIARLGVNVSAWDMTERLLEAADEQKVISGLRYRNLDPTFPFVAVKTSARVNSLEAVNALAAQVAESYEGVGIRGFTFWEQPSLDLFPAETWATVVAGSTAVAARSGTRDLPDGLMTSWPDSADEVLADYQSEHRKWRSNAPVLSTFVPASDQPALDAAADEGLLMVLRDSRGFAGLVAATTTPLFGRRAISMLDFFLTQRLRSRGVASAVQSAFVSGQRSGTDTVWGHIHATNLPSMRTAQKLGRRPVQQEYFVTLPSS